MNKKNVPIFMIFEMVTILVHLCMDWIVHAGLFHTLDDSGCACLDPIPLNASQSRLFLFFLSSRACIGDTRPRLIKFAINK